MANPQPITAEWLTSRGYEHDPYLGYVKHIADGPDDTKLALLVGRYPWNSPAVTIIVAGFGIVTRALTREHIEALEAALDGAQIDHPHVAEIDDGE